MWRERGREGDVGGFGCSKWYAAERAGWMDERCFRPLLCTVKAELGQGQPQRGREGGRERWTDLGCLMTAALSQDIWCHV